MKPNRYYALLIIIALSILRINAQEIAPITNEDKKQQVSYSDTISSVAGNMEVASSDSLQPVAEEPKKDNIFKKFFNQLFKGNKDKTHERPIDLSFVVFPFYSQEASVGLGGVVTALYRLDRTDSIIQPSDLQFFANVTLKGEYKISIGGNNHFNRKSRIHYYAQFYNKPLDFWGISYDACKVNEVSVYTRRLFNFEADYVYNITDNFHIGPSLNMGYSYLSNIGDISYLQGQRTSYWLTGIGASIVYDTRDFIPNPKRGIYVALQELIYPKFLSNASKDVYKTTLTIDYFQPLWKDAVMAVDLYGMYSGKDTPWPLRAELGEGGSRMRGFYAGRYIDNNQLNAQLELRQRIIKRVGVVAWIGYGGVFESFDRLSWDNMLLNYGAGVRFELKHNVNLRVDFGFGRDTFGVVFNMGEAF